MYVGTRLQQLIAIDRSRGRRPPPQLSAVLSSWSLELELEPSRSAAPYLPWVAAAGDPRGAPSEDSQESITSRYRQPPVTRHLPATGSVVVVGWSGGRCSSNFRRPSDVPSPGQRAAGPRVPSIPLVMRTDAAADDATGRWGPELHSWRFCLPCNHRAQPIEELSPTERSEVFGPSEARRDPEPREGRQAS